MKRHTIFGMIILLLITVTFGTGYSQANANDDSYRTKNDLPTINQLAAQTPLPTSEPVVIGYPTPAERVLPPIGRNTGLVIGASLLVLIIIGGVLSSRARQKH